MYFAIYGLVLCLSTPIRLSKLLEEIMGEKEHKTLIFVETKRKCDEISRRLRRDGWPAVCIHGDKAQPERDWVLQGVYISLSPSLPLHINYNLTLY